MVRPRANCPPDGMSERVVVERMPSDPSLFNSLHHRGDSGHQPDPIVFSLLLRPIIMAGPRGKDLRGKKKVRPCECLRELNCGCAQRVCAQRVAMNAMLSCWMIYFSTWQVEK